MISSIVSKREHNWLEMIVKQWQKTIETENCTLPMGGLSQFVKPYVEFFSPTQIWELERLVPQSTPQYNRPFFVLFPIGFFSSKHLFGAFSDRLFWCSCVSCTKLSIDSIPWNWLMVAALQTAFPTSHCCIVENKIGIQLWRRISQNRYIETPTVLYRHT